ncbi:ABC transporter transmembrane domain-containing protein [Nocardiopsis metallicus]|uniref:ABC-type multidrug transport system fused ATPase/permease subunit n=1 Tax=Nocardiopsis metallicus TaxID=179819 RepID=A0A840W7Y5_9ACTN|nr:ABC transporter ATP-binding protein [Nocardiopsis metallicus]MBB5493160.1 ABC-type multidrug transport system fused ATPase/permease subunit [Nocardiopsis metallicus]
MRVLPEPPGTPDHRSANRYLLWLARKEWRSLLWASLITSVYFLCTILVSYLLGAALDSGLADGGLGTLLYWSGLITLCALLAAAMVPLYERSSAFNWYSAAYRTIQLVTRRSSRLGPTLTRRLPTGEVVAVGTDDIDRVGTFYERSDLMISSVVSVLAVGFLMLASHLTFGLIVLVAVPLIVVGMVPLLRPLNRRTRTHRDRQADLTTRATDLVAGLRVLRGVGGERSVGDRYQAESQRVRAAGVRVGWMDAALEAVRTLYPGLLLVGIVWYGARLALVGEITVGQLVAFYGYTGSLAAAVRFFMRFASDLVTARVAAARVVRVLALEHDLPEPAVPAQPPAGTYDLHDPTSGVSLTRGRLTGVVCADQADVAPLVQRLGRYRDGGAELTGADSRRVALRDLPLAEVRRRVLVAGNDAHLFSGRLREELDPDGSATDEHLTAMVRTAAAEDVLAQSPEGLDAELTERGREYSGGQQQRLRLARALLRDPDVLILVEPTSAVDAHSEAAVAERLAGARPDRATGVVTTSPLLLDRTDHVQFVVRGRVVAEGTHRDLLRTDAYAATVLRTPVEEEKV